MTDSAPSRIGFPFVGDTIGGSQVSVLLLIGALDRTRFEPVIVLHEEGHFAEYLTARNIDYVLAPRIPLVVGGGLLIRLRAMLKCSGRLAAFLREQKIDIVHTNDARMHLTWVLAARRAGAKFVWHQRTRLRLANSVYFTLLAHRVFAVSEFIRGGYSNLLRPKVRTLLDPVVLETSVPARDIAKKRLCEELSVPEHTRLIAFVGNLRDQKRPMVCVEAASALKQRYGEDVLCLFFGEERMPTAQRVQERIAELDLSKTCRLMGSRFPIEPLLAGCDLLMAPAVYEGFGRVLIEAMLVGTPVIASSDGGHLEIVDHGLNGLLVPVDDSSAFAASAIDLLEDPVRANALAKAARDPAFKRHSLKRHAEIVQNCYASMLPFVGSDRLEPDITMFLYDLGGGGAQRVAVNLITAWIEKGRRVQLITWLPEESDFYVLPSEVQRVVIGPKPLDSGRLAAHLFNVKAVFRIRQHLRRHKPRAVVSFITVTNIFVILASLGLKCRIIVSERNDPTRQKAGIFIRNLRRLLYRFASVVTANSVNAVEAMTGYVPRSKLAAVRNPVVITDPVPDSERLPVVLSVGRLVPQKNHRLIIAALAWLGAKSQGWKLEILGAGPEHDALTKQAQSGGMADQVNLPGLVEDPNPHYRAAGIFVLSSFYEGTPNVLLEAMAYGLPCIVSDSLLGALEYVEDHESGLVFRSDDAEHLGECLQLLIEQPALRERLGKEARRRMQDYSVEIVSAQWDSLLFPSPDAQP
ncbi:glycosyltransferase [Denitrobaculum tricleocarpae]|uniref:glycosyltransferase n=1 Tax=Denitrobaculum tricleocarpae TaxID=2591009 RepID=UPI0015D360B6|nr:glycosyltransferase [Denitrobaculum tricleocarpae]